jgi:transposase InsO family protein
MKLSVDKRFWIIKRRLQGASVVFICQQAGISRDTFYRYWCRFQREGWSGLGIKSHRPQTIHRTSQETVDYVLKLRENRGWGPNRIEGHIKHDKPEGVELVGHSTVYRIICQAGMNKPLEEPRKTWGKKRFQRSKPNEMWQTDWKLTRDDEWMITYLDDCSRFIPASDVFDNANTENALDVLKQAMSEYGKPQQILTDQGVQFYTWQEGGKTQLTKYLERNEIQHIVASKRRPTTIGKVERFNGSYEREAWRFSTHGKYIHHYNYELPHQALGYLTPADVYSKEV